MTTSLTKRLERKGTRGFTLVEILIVLLLIAILMALIIPNFFGAKQKAGDRVAQQTLKSAVTASKSVGTDSESFSTATATSLKQVEPNVVWTAGDSVKNGNARPVSFNVTTQTLTGDTLWLTAQGENQDCWVVRLTYGTDANGSALSDQYGVFKTVGTAGCSASAASTATGIKWAQDASNNYLQSFPDHLN